MLFFLLFRFRSNVKEQRDRQKLTQKEDEADMSTDLREAIRIGIRGKRFGTNSGHGQHTFSAVNHNEHTVSQSASQLLSHSQR